MAAFARDDPNDRNAFVAHMAMVMASPDSCLRAITHDSQLVSTIASYVSEGATQVTYWSIAATGTKGSLHGRSACFSRRSRFGRSEPVPRATTLGLYGSFRREGFHPIGTEVSFAPGRDTAIQETILEPA